MGYSEVLCHICGVSFNIRRFRTDKEPRSAAWGDECAFADVFDPEDCPQDGGCYYVKRDSHEDSSVVGSSEPVKALPSDIAAIGYLAQEWEHIASPGCHQNNAYNGHHISVEAMRGCNVLQCLMRKQTDWEPEPDDEAFETSGHFFLSGLGDHMPSRDMATPRVFPVRHGDDYPEAENSMFYPESAEECAMPFHPTCLEVFKRASLHRYGVVDIECLTQWWGLEAIYEDFFAFPRHDAVKDGQEQSWEHNWGDEFLVANPCFVPGLEPLLSSTQCLEGCNYDPAVALTAKSPSPSPRDIFARLPVEIRLLVLFQLSFKEIANLRLASRTFQHLPPSLFCQLIMRDMPWLYEAWSSLPISFWATTTQAEIEKHDEYFKVPRPTTSVTVLSRDETDWCRLLTDIKRNWNTLLGLQNRQRIWDDCQEILNRVDAYRRQGKIKPGQAVDVIEVARQGIERQREEGRRWRRFCDAGREGTYNSEDWA